MRARWPSTEWETGPAQKSEKNGKKMENGPRPEMAEKWPPKWKNGPKMGFWPSFLYFFHFGGHFSAISGRGPFSILFPFFSDFCAGPVSHSVDGHRARNCNCSATWQLTLSKRFQTNWRTPLNSDGLGAASDSNCGNNTSLAWPCLQSLAVKKSFIFCKFWAVKNFLNLVKNGR